MSDYDYEDGSNTERKESLSTNITSNKFVSDSSFDDLFSNNPVKNDDLFPSSDSSYPSFSFSSPMKRNETQYNAQQLEALLNAQVEQLSRPKLSDIFANPELISAADLQIICNHISSILTFAHPELTLQDRSNLEEVINDAFSSNGSSTRITFDCPMNCRMSRHDASKAVYTVYSLNSIIDAGANGSIKKPIAEFKLNQNNNWISKSYNEDNLNKIVKEVTALKKYNDKTLEERLIDIVSHIQNVENALNNDNPAMCFQVLHEIYAKLDLYKKHKKLLSSLQNEFETSQKGFPQRADDRKSFHLIPALGLMYQPYQRGITLEKNILRSTDTIEQRIEILRNLAVELQMLHEKKMVHNDLRPANVMVNNDRTVIIDFGLAVESGKKHDGNINLVCAAPEVYNQKYNKNSKFNSFVYDPAQDIFSLGLIYREMLYGTRKRIWEVEEIVNVNNDHDLAIKSDNEISVRPSSDDSLKEIYAQLNILEQKIALLLNNGDCDNATIPMRNASPKIQNDDIYLDEKYTLEVPNAEAMLLNVDSNKPSTKSLFITTSRPDASIKITGIKFDGSLADSQLSDETQAMIEELGAGLLAVDPENRFKHQQISEKFNALSSAIKAEKQVSAQPASMTF